jgi:hypothetical protein
MPADRTVSKPAPQLTASSEISACSPTGMSIGGVRITSLVRAAPRGTSSVQHRMSSMWDGGEQLLVAVRGATRTGNGASGIQATVSLRAIGAGLDTAGVGRGLGRRDLRRQPVAEHARLLDALLVPAPRQEVRLARHRPEAAVAELDETHALQRRARLVSRCRGRQSGQPRACGALAGCRQAVPTRRAAAQPR